MAERFGGRRRSRRDSLEASPSATAPPPGPGPPGGPAKERRPGRRAGKPMKERWLLTRKTWRYMADAGRRLIPEGVPLPGRPEDVPRLEQYFQEVCAREPRFLLWRKSSYPGSLALRAARRRRPRAGGSCRAKTCSADEAEIGSPSPGSGSGSGPSPPKADLARLRRDWLLKTPGPSANPSPPTSTQQPREAPQDPEAKALADMLQRYLNVRGPGPSSGAPTSPAAPAAPAAAPASRSAPSSLDYQKLVEKLEQHLDQMMADSQREGAAPVPRTRTSKPYQSDYVHKSLMETLGRYYNKSPNRQHVISDILTDRKLLEKLYFDLRCTRGFRGPRATGAYTSPSARWWGQQGRSGIGVGPGSGRDLVTAPPLIAVQGPSTERGPVDTGCQTEPVTRDMLEALLLEREREEQLLLQASPPPSARETQQSHKPGRRRSSVDNDDVSPSVGDTIKRYLRMARKKSMDSDKVDRFKRVNYDRNLRNIRAKGEAPRPGDDEGNSRGCQTEDAWLMGYRELRSLEPGEALIGACGGCCSDAETTASPASRGASSRSSIDAGLGPEEAPATPKHHQSFLSHLLHGSHGAHKDKPHSAPGSPALTTSSNPPGGSAMQKSKSSSSVVHHGSRLVAKKIWKSRSKSSSRAVNVVSAWTPQGKCTWAGTSGRRVTLQDTPLRSLSEVERKVLCRVAVAKLQALNLGVHIRPPSESLNSGSVTAKPKRRAYLLKRKALTTGFFDSKAKDDKDKESSGGLVFGISLSQCLENDRLARIASGEMAEVGCLSRSSRHGSRTSFASLNETTTAAKTDEGGSCESLSSKGGVGPTGSDSGGLELSDSGPPGEWDAVPSIVRQCVGHLEAKGLHTLGIFRVSPSKKRVRQLREEWDCGRESKVGADQCPHDVAALLKEFFRDLPDPLLCRDLYQAFVHTQKIRNRRLQQEALQHLIQLLPTPNRETLFALLNFLSEVAANSEDRKGDDGEPLLGNKMDTTNLATVFAPNILHCVKPGQARSEVSAERAEERIDVINVVRALLEHVGTLFVLPAALLDELYLHMMDSHPAELDLALSRRADEQCVDEADLCSEAENYSVEESLSPSATASPTSPTAPASLVPSPPHASTATAAVAAVSGSGARRLYSREECLHQAAGVGGDIGPRPRRSKRQAGQARRREDSETRRNSLDSGSSEDPADPRRKSSPMVITASLTIPMSGAFTLNLDDPDIPYIEDSASGQARQQGQPSAPPRRQRQHSASGSEGGGGVGGGGGGGGGGGRHGSDSAVGSSATLSGDQPPSSPPSWASSPPTSPDSAVTAVSYIPDHNQPQQPSQQQAVLQRVSFTRSPELRQITRSSSQQEACRASIAPPYTPSITSIGGAVMRSKTADIERMLHINRPESSARLTSAAAPISTIDNKKYTKRRYTDSRHQTRHIPDAESLASSGSSSLASRISSALQGATSPSSATSAAASKSAAQPVWKRRELISSAPKDRGSFF